MGRCCLAVVALVPGESSRPVASLRQSLDPPSFADPAGLLTPDEPGGSVSQTGGAHIPRPVDTHRGVTMSEREAIVRDRRTYG